MSVFIKHLTFCSQVRNYLPSISAAIGDFTPQRYIWRVCICLHSAPRFMVACLFYNYYTSFRVSYMPALYKFCAGLTCLLHVLENLALVLLSYVSSTENYRKTFVFFFSEVLSTMKIVQQYCDVYLMSLYFLNCFILPFCSYS